MVRSIEVVKALSDTSAHGLFTLPDPDSRIEVLLVWLVLTFWVADGLLKVVMLVLDVVSDTSQIGVLQVGI